MAEESRAPEADAAAQRPTDSAPTRNSAADAYTTATPAEHARFLNAVDHDAVEADARLDAYLAWRRTHLDDPLARANVPTLGDPLPSMLSFTGHALDGSRLAVVFPASYDAELASVEQYVDAIAAAFDRELDRASDEKLTLVIDVRGGNGWPNASPTTLIPFARACSNVMGANFPERVRKVVLYPLPWWATAIWAVVAEFLDARTRQKFVLLSGPAARTEPIPLTISEHIAEPSVALIEAARAELQRA